MNNDVHVDVGAYAVGALEPEERQIFEDHLRTCEGCTREVAEFHETTARLAELTETAPPPALRASVLAAAQQVRPLPPLGGAPRRAMSQEQSDELVAQSPAEDSPMVSAGASSVETTTAQTRPVDELARRRQRRTVRALTGLAAAAVVAALAMGGWAGTLNQQIGEVSAREAAVGELLSAPDARTLPVELAAGGTVNYTVAPSEDRALLSAASLPVTDEGMAYQLWTMDLDVEGAPVLDSIRPNEVFRGGSDLQVVFAGSADADAFAVTVEQAAGATTPDLDTVFGIVDLR